MSAYPARVSGTLEYEPLLSTAGVLTPLVLCSYYQSSAIKLPEIKTVYCDWV
jgi:hypothetical protein